MIMSSNMQSLREAVARLWVKMKVTIGEQMSPKLAFDVTRLVFGNVRPIFRNRRLPSDVAIEDYFEAAAEDSISLCPSTP